MNKKYASALFLTVMLVISGFAVTAHAQSATTVGAPTIVGAQQEGQGENEGRGPRAERRGGMPGMMKPVVAGTVTAINGNTVTITSKSWTKDSSGKPVSGTPTTYTVDISNAKIQNGRTAGAVTDIAVGKMIAVQGTKNGTTVTATSVNLMGGKMGLGMGEGKGLKNNLANLPQGNGQPVIGGIVSAVNGTSISITNQSNVSYTVDATSAKILKQGQSGTIASIVVGDSIVAQGTVNGTSIVAATVADQGVPPAAPTVNGVTTTTPAPAHTGFFGGVRNFFSHIFGF